MNPAPLALTIVAPCLALIAPAPSTSLPSHESSTTAAHSPVVEKADANRVIDVAICLDTSGSMDGLIDSARQKLWAIVNDLALAEPTPKLRVALLTYGNDGHNRENGWVNVESDLTDDLDLISQRLFALTTNGGTELVARVIQSASQELSWHPSDDAMKLIIVAGNESADQDRQFPFREVCRATISSGVMVNSIYCQYSGDNSEVESGWREVAKLSDGQFAMIDQNNGTVVIATPYDEPLIELNAQINATYIAYGTRGQWGAQNQTEQDDNAASLGAATAAQRVGCKATTLYCNSTWDLVDACRSADFKLEDVRDEDLPENMRAMTVEQRKAHVDEIAKKRADVQAAVQSMLQKREAFVAQEQQRLALDDTAAFDFAVRTAIRKQAEAKGFKFPAMPAAAAGADAIPPGSELGPVQTATTADDGC